ncbi:hypothetical protein [Photobacterium nomapromontoriensis]|uniref:hypothetical protein n=1 Tax=Photobacterium nomapromontoriensis TaxID=2910237 RepID=UPI003D1383A0
MNRRSFLSFLILVPTFCHGALSINNELNIDMLYKPDGSLTFLSSGDQILSNENGLILKLNDGRIIYNKEEINIYLSSLNNIKAAKQIIKTDSKALDFNKVIYIRNGEDVKGSEVTAIFDNKGVVIESYDTLGDVNRFYYDSKGNWSMTDSSLRGILLPEK